MTAPRIAIDGRVISDHFPGIGRYAFHLIAALAAHAPMSKLLVIVAPGQHDQRFAIADLASQGNVALVEVPGPPWRVQTQLRLRAALADAAVDVFHATWIAGALAPGTTTVLSLYDLIAERVPDAVPPARRLVWRAITRWVTRRAAHVLTLSECSRADIVACLAVPASRITVSPLAADARFRPATDAEVARVRARHSLPRRFVLYLGINKPHKNLRTLLAAWRGVGVARPDLVRAGTPDECVLVVAGTWDERYSAIRDAEAIADTAAPLRFLGRVDEEDLPALYSAATLFAFPSRYEGFGLPPLEAMSCGTAVVAADASSLPEVVGDAGMLVGADDVSGWTDALARCLGDPALAADLGRRGRARASSFTWALTARRTFEAYEHALRDRRLRSPG